MNAPTQAPAGSAPCGPLVALVGDYRVATHARELRAWTQQSPAWRIEVSEALALAASGGELGVLSVDGQFDVHAAETGERVRSVIRVRAPRALAGAREKGCFAVVSAVAVCVVTGKRVEVHRFKGGIAAAFSPDGSSIWIVGAGSSVARVTIANGVSQLEVMPPSPVQLSNITPRGFALGSDGLYRRTADDRWARVSSSGSGSFLAESPNGQWLALQADERVVAVARVSTDGGVEDPALRIVYSDSYRLPNEEPISLRGLAFASDDELLVLLDEGRGNLIDLDPPSPFKLDSHYGDPASSWTFSMNGEFYVAEAGLRPTPEWEGDDDTAYSPDEADEFDDEDEEDSLTRDYAREPFARLRSVERAADVTCARCGFSASNRHGPRDEHQSLVCLHCAAEVSRELVLSGSLRELLAATAAATPRATRCSVAAPWPARRARSRASDRSRSKPPARSWRTIRSSPSWCDAGETS